jgi:protein-S-isoprenylcysteine O-methyltransferase Ste14
MRVVDLVFLFGWVVFWLYWLSAAFGNRSGRFRWGQFAAARVLLVLLVLLLVRLRVLKGHETTSDPLLWGIGLALFAAGLGVAVWARITIGRNWGMPMTEKDDPELVTRGPYHAVRHPIYSGMLLAMIGTTIGVSIFWLVALVVLGAYFIYSAAMEERYLTKRFPDSYPHYKESTKMLVPFLF